nr:hypothetical protein Iba_chr13bCG6990 [Ipomoea batatas]
MVPQMFKEEQEESCLTTTFVSRLWSRQGPELGSRIQELRIEPNALPITSPQETLLQSFRNPSKFPKPQPHLRMGIPIPTPILTRTKRGRRAPPTTATHEIQHLISLTDLPLHLLQTLLQLSLRFLQLLHSPSQPQNLLIPLFNLLQQPPLLLLPRVAVAREDLHNPGISLGVLFPPGEQLLQLLLCVYELESELLVVGLEP